MQNADCEFEEGTIPSDVADALAAGRPRLGALGTPLVYLSTVASTNDVAAMLAARGSADGTVVVADAQTNGRGRRGHSWFSPPGNGLYVSAVIEFSGLQADAARAASLLTLAAGVALAEAIETVTGLRADIKWPNDLLIGGRKVAGILAETVAGAADCPRIVLGYGINVGLASYPPELAGRASSLEKELGRSVDRASLLAETLAALAHRRADLVEGRFDAILAAWADRSPISRGAHIHWHDASGERAGITAGIDEYGALLVNVERKTERIIAGEVEFENL